MESIIGGLVDYGMAGLFIAFMVWQYMQNQKRMDALQDKFLESIDKVRKENKENEELIRARYDKVVETYQNTKDNLLRELSDTVKDLQSSIIKLESMESSSMIRITELGDTVEDVKSLLDKREQERRAEKEATLIALANQQKNTKE